jgi:hypothetical protein
LISLNDRRSGFLPKVTDSGRIWKLKEGKEGGMQWDTAYSDGSGATVLPWSCNEFGLCDSGTVSRNTQPSGSSHVNHNFHLCFI